MNSRRLTTAGLGVVAALTFAIAGCGETKESPGNKPAGGAPPAGQDATAALTAAAEKLGDSSFKMTMDMGDKGTMTGAMDPQKQQGEYKMKISAEGQEVSIEVRKIGDETFTKMKMPGIALPGFDGKKWMRTKASEGNPAAMGNFDAGKVAQSLEHSAKVERVGDREFRGTMDLTKASDALGQKKEEVAALGDKAKAIPFEASLDEQGRLVRYKLEMPALGKDSATTMEIKYSDFGIPVDVEAPPASKVVEGPGA